ncbi:hypothetical protein IW261DRAFT_1415692 [Armillaria novae-zelandiae]|uniref:Zn(2)-C6 fungal-type domain-containing protein n=1 Tax=Armillaria novae-zelandiae TaxID=153914 RepID=A0AA39PM97_9AGAR|nr:hypothetical protein IW261DRAFT_1415692 [Armillaria novae-zelandiae]
MSFSQNYLPPPPTAQYYPPHSPPLTDAQAQRKRPKYTRSKTGCMTCRVKKIKCDETKPNCMRCTHGQRDCTWPDGVPPRKKQPGRKGLVRRAALHRELVCLRGLHHAADAGPDSSAAHGRRRWPAPPRLAAPQLPPVMSPDSRQCVRSGYAPEMGMQQDMPCYPRYDQQQQQDPYLQYRSAHHRQMPVAQWSTSSSLMPPVESYHTTDTW